MPISIKALQDDALDAAYLKAAGVLLAQIKAITNLPNSQIQRSLRGLDVEAKRLADAKERITPTNAQLEKTLRDNEAAFVATQTMILAGDDGIQLSGQSLAVNAVTAKVFSAIAGQMIANKVDPMSPAGLKIFKDTIARTGISWATPDATTFARDFVNSAEWLAKMEGWGSGYAELTRDTMINGISQGWGPIKTAAEMRRYAQNLPVSAAENLTRTLQLTSFREASAAMETANSEFIEGKIRIATLDDRTCVSCIALHGTPMKLGERVDDHYRGRCSEFYQVLGGPKFPEQMQADSTPGNRNFVPYQSGEDWFNSLSPERQAQQASFLKSPAKLRAYRDGVPLSSFVGEHTDDVFGNQFVEKSLVGAIGDDAVGYYTNKPKPPSIPDVPKPPSVEVKDYKKFRDNRDVKMWVRENPDLESLRGLTGTQREVLNNYKRDSSSYKPLNSYLREGSPKDNDFGLWKDEEDILRYNMTSNSYMEASLVPPTASKLTLERPSLWRASGSY